ncbi:hypothetical protein NP493_475g02002 [Ridgeia piscesae]|uniref:Uncharacterized protein n=1 Tax=Ridgeia piscesae TaxID=27915 RepID=A0AAD9KZF8_RIDPI|nr:hypothetical protein NP493_475g02002 [Ridgeia piscesae]
MGYEMTARGWYVEQPGQCVDPDTKYGDHASVVEQNPDPTTPGKERRLYRPGSLASSLGDLEAGSISLRTKSFSGR